jgi:peptidoglycan/xylan/chitin deacetylase (PgdA/CDA1 family)
MYRQLPVLIGELRARGYEFVRIDALLAPAN